MADADKKKPEPKYDPEKVRDISEKIYRVRLDREMPPNPKNDEPGNVARMLEKDNDGGVKLRKRAEFYDLMTKDYLDALEIQP